MTHSRGARRRALDTPDPRRLFAIETQPPNATPSPRGGTPTVLDLMRRTPPTAAGSALANSASDEALMAGVVEHLARAVGATNTVVVAKLDAEGARARVVASYPRTLSAEFDTASSIFSRVRGMAPTVEIAGVRRQFPADVLLQAIEADSFVGAAVRDEQGREIGWVAAVNGRSALNPELASEMTSLAADAVRGAVITILNRRVDPERALVALVPTRMAMDVARDGYWEWDLTRDALRFSAKWMELAGYPAEAGIGTSSSWLDRMHPEDRCRFERELADVRAGRCVKMKNEHRLRCADGNYRWVCAQGVVVESDATGPLTVAGWLLDVSEQREVEAQLASGSFRDSLTGLPNRGLFMDRLRHVLDRARRHRDYHYAVLSVDLDHFRRVNARFGDVGGDELLATVAQRLRAAMRPGDTIARTSGDKFAILLEDIRSAADAIRVADRLQRVFEAPFRIGTEDVYMTASAGIAVSDTGYERGAEVIRDADIAMGRARDVGDGRPALFDKAMHQAASARLQLETDLRHALERGEFEVYYQPIVSGTDQSPFAFEALLRWRHPSRGLLPAAAFVDGLHESGLIVPVGNWVLRQVCQQTAAWRIAMNAEVVVSVNLSARQLAHPSLLQDVRAAIDDAGAQPSAIMLEITEESIIGERAAAAALLSDLRASGVRFLLDDFGTGYSSLSYLRELPVDAVKIDREFLDGIHASASQQAVVRAIVGLAADLAMQVVAEGVETAEQLDTVARLGCGLVQGFAIAPPMDAMATLGFIRQRKSNVLPS